MRERMRVSEGVSGREKEPVRRSNCDYTVNDHSVIKNR